MFPFLGKELERLDAKKTATLGHGGTSERITRLERLYQQNEEASRSRDVGLMKSCYPKLAHRFISFDWSSLPVAQLHMPM